MAKRIPNLEDLKRKIPPKGLLDPSLRGRMGIGQKEQLAGVSVTTPRKGQKRKKSRYGF